MCLWLNYSQDKSEVMRQKIFLFYFAGEFSLGPFQSMALLVFPKIMDQIHEHRLMFNTLLQLWMDVEGTYTLSAIFRMLRFFPGLCNVSSRTEAS
jgi:hypothetical protein